MVLLLWAGGAGGRAIAQQQAAEEMVLNVSGPTVTCDDPNAPTSCTVGFDPANPDATMFTVSVHGPTQGSEIAGFQAEVLFGGLTWNQGAACEDHVVMPNMGQCIFNVGLLGQPQVAALTALQAPPLPVANPGGSSVELAQFQVSCPDEATFVVALTDEPSSPLGALYNDANASVIDVAAQGQPVQADLNADTIVETVETADSVDVTCVILPTPTPAATATPELPTTGTAAPSQGDGAPLLWATLGALLAALAVGLGGFAWRRGRRAS
jgi:hypothetical protein